MTELLTTLIGSLPFKSKEECISYSLQHDVPAIPEMITLDGTMHSSSFLNHGDLVCASLFKKELKKRGIEQAKIQSPGPLTAILYGDSTPDDAVRDLRSHLEGLADGLNHLKTLYVFLDEPALGTNLDEQLQAKEEKPVDYSSLWEQVFKDLRLPKSTQIVRGIHDCNQLEDHQLSAILRNTSVDLLSFDATTYTLPELQRQDADWRTYGTLCWGVINLAGKAKILKPQTFLKEQNVPPFDHDLISHACGFANLLPNACTLAYDYLKNIKQYAKEL